MMLLLCLSLIKGRLDEAEGNKIMTAKKMELINEQASPLFRIMYVHDAKEPSLRKFDNNICAFHIGDGYILSVAHNLRSPGVLRSISPEVYETGLQARFNKDQARFFEQHYPVDYLSGKHHLASNEPAVLQELANILAQVRFDTRWVTLAAMKVCTPHLLIQFRNGLFYNDRGLTELIDPNMQFFEGGIQRQTYLLELELVHAFYNEDIALYRIVNVPQQLLQRLPCVRPDYTLLDNDVPAMYCLQSAPVNEVGRLLNDARIEGHLDHFTMFADHVTGSYVIDGIRYLVKGYFRFGSSGAPYLLYDEAENEFVVNAIQSEASPLQLSINSNMAGNYQYVNAIATPLHSIKDKLEEFMTG
ncbi:MAG: hypothetical protein BGO69_16115 [Bacteroidetes bacterium 46-16]|nr:MAG: hypothetical protein BGO69_16115 [Bacteroidetes bacterium 46-16]